MAAAVFVWKKKMLTSSSLITGNSGSRKSHKLNEMLQHFLVSEFFKEFKKYLFI